MDDESIFHTWPLLAHDAVEGRIPGIAIGLNLVLAHDALEHCTDLFERAPGPRVVRLGPKLNPVNTESLEAILKQKLFALGVDASSPKFTRDPGDADFNFLVARMNVEEPGGSNDPTATMANQERLSVAVLPVAQGRLEVYIKDGGIGVVHRRQPPDFAVTADAEEFVQTFFFRGMKFNHTALEDQWMLKPLDSQSAPIAIESARRSTQAGILPPEPWLFSATIEATEG